MMEGGGFGGLNGTAHASEEFQADGTPSPKGPEALAWLETLDGF